MIVLSGHNWIRLIYSSKIPESIAEENIYPGRYVVGGPRLPLLDGAFGVSYENQDNTVIGIHTQLRLVGEGAVFASASHYCECIHCHPTLRKKCR